MSMAAKRPYLADSPWHILRGYKVRSLSGNNRSTFLEVVLYAGIRGIALLDTIFTGGNTGVGGGGGGAIDFASLLNNAGSTPDYSAFLNAAAAGGGASGIDYSSILGGAAGGGNVDIAAFLAAQNKLGGLAGVIGNLGGLGLG
ncbi:hypothetical protein AXG93_2654s1050 [Marchantia polymorpha subsp. ruderalis]|uniref:Uncharacterized protein n=1 Tax=Marchantia polymorpha subsp. ruderalis TaxID=1480154 RepID=A0A176W3F2_MARPO|nr:hypothetical protein AXG93_2654s1050 [Marchantia polymorpha subsp. ruderalis]